MAVATKQLQLEQLRFVQQRHERQLLGLQRRNGRPPGTSGATGSSGATANGLVTTPVDTAAQGKPGGVWKDFLRADATHFDSLISDTSQVVSISGYLGYAKLLKWKVGRYPKIADGTSEGEHAESWELSPDKLTLTFKLRQGMKFDTRAPTNGRAADSGDVVWSWNKYIANNPGAKSLAYTSESTAAAVESVSAPDANTVVFKMHQPDASIIPLFSAADKFYVFPIEADSKFDPKQEIRGAGPWMLTEYVPSTRFVWSKNPNYYVKGRPFPDTLERPIITDPSQQAAQFRTGNIYSDVMGGFGGFQLDVVPTHKDLPATQIYQVPVFPERDIWYMTFGYDGDSPFKDVRVRQAMSMSIDRDAYSDAIDNRDKFAQQGLDLQWKYCTVLGAGWGDYYLDPESSAFGPNAKYLHHNIADAKQLMSAAGFPSGTAFDFYWLNDNTFGALYNSIVQLYQAMFQDVGLKGNLKGLPFNSWVDQIVQAYFYQETLKGTRHGYSRRAAHGRAPLPDRGQPGLGVTALPGRLVPRHDPGRQGRLQGRPQAQRLVDADQRRVRPAEADRSRAPGHSVHDPAVVLHPAGHFGKAVPAHLARAQRLQRRHGAAGLHELRRRSARHLDRPHEGASQELAFMSQ